MRALLLFAIVSVLCVWTSAASAHAMRSVLVEIDELGPGHATVNVRSSVPDATLDIALDGCSLSSERIACGDGALAGHVIAASGLGPVLGEAVISVRFFDGRTASRILTRDESSWSIPARPSALSVAWQYAKLGTAHILTGYDHLLFLFLLVLSLRTVRAVLLAETAFTLSHSLSFSATALGWVHIAPIAAETLIAASLVLVALDVGRVERGGAGLAFLFGLVHGLGFAGGLAEIGLPDRDVAAALVSFGGGVEVGQVAFLAAVLGVVHVARRAAVWPKISLASTYASGAIAMSWFIERAWGCL